MMKKIALFIVLAGLSAGHVQAADLAFENQFPVVGEDQDLSLRGIDQTEGMILRVTYSPNSETSSEEEVGVFSAGGEISWRPSRSGIATLSVQDAQGATVATKNVAVVLSSTPRSGVLVMLLAGLLLFGGAGFSLRLVLRSGLLTPS